MKKTYELIAPCHFGLEAVLKKEIQDLGYEISMVEDGKVTFLGDDEAICRANVFLRTAERVLLKVGSFQAVTYEELFQATKALPWEELIPADGKFWVAKAASIKSKLFSPSDIQSIMKKAIVERLKSHYNIQWFSEAGDSYPLRVALYKDQVTAVSYTHLQATQGRAISADQMRPGDLIFYSSGSRINHVALYIGNGQVVHASTPETGIKTSPWNYRTPVKIVNVMGD